MFGVSDELFEELEARRVSLALPQDLVVDIKGFCVEAGLVQRV